MIRALCYEGLPRTQTPYVDQTDRHLPRWEPITNGSRVTFPDGVPEPFVRACLFSVPFEEYEQRWGTGSGSPDPASKYLLDRKLLITSTDSTPICAAFKNYFNDVEILATIKFVRNENGRFYMWDVKHSALSVLHEVNHRLITPRPYIAFKLTERAHELLDAELTESETTMSAAVDPKINPSTPDTIGHVLTPLDPSAFVPISVIRAEHCEGVNLTSIKAITNALEDYTANRVRWTRPWSEKLGRPNLQRRSVHLADWRRYVSRLIDGTTPGDDGFPELTATQIEERKAAMGRARQSGK